jgi:hypothetical protein
MNLFTDLQFLSFIIIFPLNNSIFVLKRRSYNLPENTLLSLGLLISLILLFLIGLNIIDRFKKEIVFLIVANVKFNHMFKKKYVQ